MIRTTSIALAIVGLLAGFALAAEPEQDQQHQPQVLKASKTIDLPVINEQAEEIGEIYDLVVSPDGRRISHVVISAGGFLGLGDKLLPVPIEAVEFGEQSEEDESWIVRIDISRERLKDAPNMEGNDWSDLTERDWADELDAYYDVDQREDQVREVRKISALVGMPIRNEASDNAENIGEVSEVVFESGSGKIRYAAMSFGGWLDIGDKLFAVPWNHISFARPAGDEQVQYLTLTEDISFLMAVSRAFSPSNPDSHPRAVACIS